jgi:hypothetical protein
VLPSKIGRAGNSVGLEGEEVGGIERKPDGGRRPCVESGVTVEEVSMPSGQLADLGHRRGAVELPERMNVSAAVRAATAGKDDRGWRGGKAPELGAVSVEHHPTAAIDVRAATGARAAVGGDREASPALVEDEPT